MSYSHYGPKTSLILFRPRKLGEEEADKPEVLVPIRLEFEVEHHKMRDSFIWNLNGGLQLSSRWEFF